MIAPSESASLTVPGSPPAAPGDGTAIACDESQLELMRRVDWRFLLPDVSANRIGYAGASTDQHFRALANLTDTLVSLTPTCPDRFDLVVVPTCESISTVQSAARNVQPGGWLYVERSYRGLARFRCGRDLKRLRETLRLGGFDAIEMHWAFPTVEAPRALIPLSSSATVRAFLAHQGSSWKSLARVSIAKLLLRTGLLSVLASDVCLVGRRS